MSAWTCTTCTFKHEGNASSFLACSVCLEMRANPPSPSSLSSPAAKKQKVSSEDAIPLDDDEDDNDDNLTTIKPNSLSSVGAQVAAERASRKPPSRTQPQTKTSPTHAPLPAFVPFRLFKTHSLQPAANESTITLPQIVQGLDIKLAIISNFMIDPTFLTTAWRSLSVVPRVIIFAGDGENSFPLPNAEINSINPKEIKFIHPTSGAAWSNKFGCHHSKFLLLVTAKGIRVAVFTANLIQSDFHFKTNGVYIQDFPLRNSNNFSTLKPPPDTPFGETLHRYLSSILPHSSSATRTSSLYPFLPYVFSTTSMSIVELISLYDYSKAYGDLIITVPGYFNANKDNDGISAVESILVKRGMKEAKNSKDEFFSKKSSSSSSSSNSTSSSLSFQFSSFSSLPPNHLEALKTKLSINSSPNCPLSIVWPSVEEVRWSFEGYAGGSSLPSNPKVVLPHVRLFRPWSSPTSSPKSPIHPFVQGRSRAVPHLKSFLSYKNNSNVEDLDYFILTSGNISQGAWGVIQSSNLLFAKNWEMGIIFSPESMRNASRTGGFCLSDDVNGLNLNGMLFYDPDETKNDDYDRPLLLTTNSLVSQQSENSNEKKKYIFPLPYSLEPSAYKRNDKPWIAEYQYLDKPDNWGRFDCSGADYYGKEALD